MNDQKIRVVLNNTSDSIYVKLPGHRLEPKIVDKSIDLDRLLPNYVGPKVVLDFDSTGRLIGIEVVA